MGYKKQAHFVQSEPAKTIGLNTIFGDSRNVHHCTGVSLFGWTGRWGLQPAVDASKLQSVTWTGASELQPASAGAGAPPV